MRYSLRLALLLAAMLIVAACGGGGVPTLDTGDDTQTSENTGGTDAQSGAADGVVTITFGVQGFQRDQYEPLVEQFNAEHSEVRVQIVVLDDLLRSGVDFDPDQMLRQVVSAADTAVPFFITPSAIERGYLQDLQPLMDADPNFDEDDFYPAVLDAYRIDGGTYALPRLVRVSLLNYNQNLWQGANLPAPDADWGWSDMIAAAEELAQTRGDEVEVYGLMELGGIATLLGELEAAGVDIFSTPAEELRLDDPAFVEALEHTVSLVEAGAVYVPISESGVSSFNSNEMQELVQNERVGMWTSNMLPNAGDIELDFELGVAPLPDSPIFSFGNFEGFVMSSGTEHPEEAWRWIEFLSRQPANEGAGAEVLGIGAQVPARISVTEESGYWERIDDDMEAAVKATLERPTRPVPESLFDNVSPFSALNNALEAVLTDEATPQQALVEAQASFDEQLAEMQLTPEPTPDTAPIVVATPVAEQAPEGATAITYYSPNMGNGSDMRELLQEFQAEHPDIFVELTDSLDDSVRESTATEFAALAATNDCFTWWGRPAPEDEASLLDLQPLLDADPTLTDDDYPAALLGLLQHDGALYGLPLTVNLPTLDYNLTAFEAAGIDVPTADWTTDDLLLAAQQLDNGAQGANRQYGFVSVGSMTNDLDYVLRQFDAQPVQGSDDAPELHFTDPAVIQGAQYYVDLLQNYSPHERLIGYQQQASFDSEPFQLLQEGRIGMWFGFGSFFGPAGPQEFEMGVAPPPLSGSTVSADTFQLITQYISAETEHAEACWDWITFLSEQPALMQGNAYPVRISVAESPEYIDQAQPGATEVYAAYREHFAAAPDGGEQQPLFGSMQSVDPFWFYRAVDRAMQGEDLERELQAAEDLTQQFIECMQVEEDSVTCTTSVDPDYNGFSAPPQSAE
jgi:multiple sugar transport system substrate-binding protein